jgi:protein tyrosine phosphatase (PTP) superfamily phosphohydrolase (DUF442 family)
MVIGTLRKRAKRAVKRVSTVWRQKLIDDTPPWLKRVAGKPAIYMDMLFLDHGIFRVVYLNKHALGPGAWRSAQPTPQQIGALARQGIRTIVNLRGERVCGSYWLEQAACERHGIRLVNYQVRSRAAPSLEELRGARELFNRIEYPMLMHCKSGSDRAGLMSVLYRHLHEGVPMADAIHQLSFKFGHIRQADTGVLDAFFERYLSDTRDRPMSFFDWVETVYDPDELKSSFQANGLANRIVNSVLRRE